MTIGIWLLIFDGSIWVWCVSVVLAIKLTLNFVTVRQTGFRLKNHIQIAAIDFELFFSSSVDCVGLVFFPLASYPWNILVVHLSFKTIFFWGRWFRFRRRCYETATSCTHGRRIYSNCGDLLKWIFSFRLDTHIILGRLSDKCDLAFGISTSSKWQRRFFFSWHFHLDTTYHIRMEFST